MSEPSHEAARVAAIVYADEAYPDAAFEVLVALCRQRGLSLAGVRQHRAHQASDGRCDMVLEDLTTGEHTALYENRGTGAKGCRLDEAALAEATARVEGSLAGRPDLLVLNKFGKAECGGGGLRDLVASAVDQKVPIVIGVPRSNLAAWRDFVGDFAVELSDRTQDVERWLEHLR